MGKPYLHCRHIFSLKISKRIPGMAKIKNRGRYHRPRFCLHSNVKEKNEGKQSVAAAATATTTRRSKQRSQRAVSIKTEEQSCDDRQSASAENIRAEEPVFRTENKQSDKDPKGYVTTLGATIHKKPPVSCRRGYVLRLLCSAIPIKNK